MYCPKCGRELKEGMKFCPKCGNPVADGSVNNTPAPAATPSPLGKENKTASNTVSNMDSSTISKTVFDSSSEQEQKKDKRSSNSALVPILVSVFCLIATCIGLFLLRNKSGDGNQGKTKSDGTTSGISQSLDSYLENTSSEVLEGEQLDQGSAASNEEASAISGNADNKADDTTESIADNNADTKANVTPEGQGNSLKTDDKGIHSYQYVHKDISWEDAWEESIRAGGYLARINTREEYEAIVSLLNVYSNRTRINYVYLGGMRDYQSIYHWKDVSGDLYEENLYDPYLWYSDFGYPGEPSYFDPAERVDGRLISETYMSLMHVQNRWYFNDANGDIAHEYPDDAGKIGYLIEFDDTSAAR